MKLKSLPEDFQVEEVTDFTSSSGPFALYRLSKEHIGTLEAVQAIAEAWELHEQQIGFGGLKDKHAKTNQFLTIKNGPAGNLLQKSFNLQYLGQAPRAFSSQDIRCNRFQITLRGVESLHRPALMAAMERCRETGVPNYFDDQRFGSLGQSRQFCAEPWCRGDYERALWLAIADFNEHDRPREREQKKILQEHWGDWELLSRKLDRSHRRQIAEILLRNPRDFRVALTVIRHDLRSLYLAAFQSHLWNELLARFIESMSSTSDLCKLEGAAGNLAFPKSADSSVWTRLMDYRIPLPSARVAEWKSPIDTLLQEILQPMNLTAKQLRVKYPRDTFFSKGDRTALMRLQEFQWDWSNDPESSKVNLQLRFELERGCYATIFVRWLNSIVVDRSAVQL